MILIDTHVWVNYSSQRHDELSAAARNAIDTADVIGISDISCWEISMLVQKGRLKLRQGTLEWISDALLNPRLEVVPLSTEILVIAPDMPDFHKDPADRMIAATCYLNGWPLVTRDRKLHTWDLIETIW
ncbi:MAG: type II toxin-antitoxin system VapC family toxin [Calditrichaeota bacterium]|nr:type II toxin-antitoxin system VapC family toxin [Calditrichota bacterium]